MTIEKRDAFIQGVLTQCAELRRSKGGDYAGKEDVLANFKRNAERLGATKYQILAIYMNKHHDAIMNSIKKNPNHPQVESEPLTSRIVDEINYLLLLGAMLYEDERSSI